MNFNDLTPAQIVFMAVVGIAFIIAIVKGVTAYVNKAKESDNFFDYIMNDFKDKVLPVITQLAFKEELTGCATYDEFKKKCIKSISLGLYQFLEENESKLPTSVVIFLTLENCEKVVDMMIQNGEIDTILEKAYDQKQHEMIEAMHEEEEKAKKLAEETAVEDETKLVKEHITENDTVDISGDLDRIINNDLIEDED